MTTANPEMTGGARYAFLVEYQGTPFSGWQYQQGAVTVQQVVQEALWRLVQERVVLFASGRTDQGVHATGQVFHADFQRPYDLDRLRRGLNAHLDAWPISILEVQPVPSSFHARFSAQKRTYRYELLNRPSPSPLFAQRAWWIPQALDGEILNSAAKILQGYHDFSAFRHRDCQSHSPWKNLDTIVIDTWGAWVSIRVEARSFLHRQVRMMVGAMVAVALKRIPLQQLEAWVKKPQGQSHKAPSAPPHGLYFVHVDFGPSNPFDSPTKGFDDHRVTALHSTIEPSSTMQALKGALMANTENAQHL